MNNSNKMAMGITIREGKGIIGLWCSYIMDMPSYRLLFVLFIFYLFVYHIAHRVPPGGLENTILIIHIIVIQIY